MSRWISCSVVLIKSLFSFNYTINFFISHLIQGRCFFLHPGWWMNEWSVFYSSLKSKKGSVENRTRRKILIRYFVNRNKRWPIRINSFNQYERVSDVHKKVVFLVWICLIRYHKLACECVGKLDVFLLSDICFFEERKTN